METRRSFLQTTKRHGFFLALIGAVLLNGINTQEARILNEEATTESIVIEGPISDNGGMDKLLKDMVKDKIVADKEYILSKDGVEEVNLTQADANEHGDALNSNANQDNLNGGTKGNEDTLKANQGGKEDEFRIADEMVISKNQTG